MSSGFLDPDGLGWVAGWLLHHRGCSGLVTPGQDPIGGSHLSIEASDASVSYPPEKQTWKLMDMKRSCNTQYIYIYLYTISKHLSYYTIFMLDLCSYQHTWNTCVRWGGAFKDVLVGHVAFADAFSRDAFRRCKAQNDAGRVEVSMSFRKATRSISGRLELCERELEEQGCQALACAVALRGPKTLRPTPMSFARAHYRTFKYT